MKIIRWRWLLPLIMVAIALFAHIYGPHEYRATALRDRAVDNPDYVFRHSPALVERLSEGINFPALVISYPIKDNDQAIYRRNSEYTLIWISARDLGFYAGVLVLWIYVGHRLDVVGSEGPSDRWSPRMRTYGSILGGLFGILTGSYALQMILSEWDPLRQIGCFGVIWSLALTIYFGWRTLASLRTAV